MSDSPRTDAGLEYDDTTVDGVKEFARQLELELNAANDRIKRLEEAGDALFENSYPSMWDLPAAADQKLTDQLNWLKAKEAKL